MKTTMAALILATVGLLAAGPAAAQLTFTCSADSTLDGNPGTLLRIVEVGFPPHETAFVFEEAGKLRVYALRGDGGSWDVLPSAVYFCPSSGATVGDSYAFMPDELDNDRTATVAAVEAVTVGAGNFANAYRIDVRLDSTGPSGPVVESIWVVEGVGMVKDAGYDGAGQVDWQDRLESYSVTGSGFWPLVVGNSWSYTLVEGASTAATSFGVLKASN